MKALGAAQHSAIYLTFYCLFLGDGDFASSPRGVVKILGFDSLHQTESADLVRL